MTFTFSIRNALKDSWQIIMRHPLYFGVLAFVMFILNSFDKYNKHTPVVSALVVIAGLIWSYVWISVSLAAVDGKESLLTFKKLSLHMPSFLNFFMMLGLGIVVGLIVAVGIVLLIIPGIYFGVRLIFVSTAYVDRQQGFKSTLEYSWHLVKGKIFWKVLLVLLVTVALMIVGVLTFGIGLLITYPLAILLMTQLYRALTRFQQGQVVVVEEMK